MKIIYRYNGEPVNYTKLGASVDSHNRSSHPDYEWETVLEIRDAGYQRLISDNTFEKNQIELYKIG